MKIRSIKNHLQPYVISRKRISTIRNAFAAAIAHYDDFEEDNVRKAVECLGQNPDSELFCVYCGGEAKTWDHLFPLVKESIYSGYGHQIGNLVPCCASCNSNKGGKNWKTWLSTKSFADIDKKIAMIENYHDRFFRKDERSEPLTEEYFGLLTKILRLMTEADELAKKIRARD